MTCAARARALSGAPSYTNKTEAVTLLEGLGLTYSLDMARLTFSNQAKTLLRGASHCLVIGRGERIEHGVSVLPEGLSRLASELAAEAKMGQGGPTLTSLATDHVRRLSVAIMPSSSSRYLSPARPDALARAVQVANLRREARSAMVLCLENEDHLEASLTGLARGLPLLDRKTQGNGNDPRIQVLIVGPDGEVIKVSADERNRVAAVRESATLVDTPPSELHPEAFAQLAKRELEELKRVSVKEIVGPNLARQKLGGVLSVGKAASSAPRVLVATFRPTRPQGPHVALVGKGVTFDTGGLHLKGRGSMEGMKCDMGGAAAVFGAFKVLAAAGCPMQVSLLLCLAENAIGPESYKPDDIITMHSGKTVEINNTDAEGRLLLADGLSYAARVLGAEVLMDAATLTGAQLVATGSNHAAVVSNDAELETAMVEAGQASGDLVHPLPFAPELYQQEFKSPIADMRNSVKNRANAQSSCAAQFLWSHIDSTDVRWTHVDLAGPAWQGERGTGFGVSLFVNAVRSLS